MAQQAPTRQAGAGRQRLCRLETDAAAQAMLLSAGGPHLVRLWRPPAEASAWLAAAGAGLAAATPGRRDGTRMLTLWAVRPQAPRDIPALERSAVEGAQWLVALALDPRDHAGCTSGPAPLTALGGGGATAEAAEAAGDALLKRLASGAAAARRLASVAGLVPGAAEVGAVQLLDVQLAAGTGVLELEAGRFDVVPLPTSASDDVLAAGRLRRIPVSPAPGDLTNDGLEAWLSQPTLEAACWRPAPIDGAQESWLAGVAATALTTWWTGADGPDARSWAGSLGLEAGEVPWLPPLTGLLAAGVARAAPGGGRAAATLRALEAASRGLRTAPEWPRLWAAGLSVGALTGTARAWWPDPRRATPLAQPWSWVLVAGAALRVLGAAGPGAQLQLEAGTRSRLALVWAPATGILPAVVPTAGGRAAAAAADARIAAAAARRVVNLVAELLLWRAGPMSAAPLLAALWAKIRRALLAAGALASGDAKQRRQPAALGPALLALRRTPDTLPPTTASPHQVAALQAAVLAAIEEAAAGFPSAARPGSRTLLPSVTGDVATDAAVAAVHAKRLGEAVHGTSTSLAPSFAASARRGVAGAQPPSGGAQ